MTRAPSASSKLPQPIPSVVNMVFANSGKPNPARERMELTAPSAEAAYAVKLSTCQINCSGMSFVRVKLISDVRRRSGYIERCP